MVPRCQNQERPRLQEPDAVQERIGIGGMNVGQMIDYLKGYDEDAEVEVEVRFGEVGESYASTFDVVPFSHEETEGSERNPWPTISADIGLGTMSEKELCLLIDHIKGIDQRLSYYKGGA